MTGTILWTSCLLNINGTSQKSKTVSIPLDSIWIAANTDWSGFGVWCIARTNYGIRVGTIFNGTPASNITWTVSNGNATVTYNGSTGGTYVMMCRVI